jgi:microcystin-dependent protein
MPYQINKTDGTVLTTIADGTRDTTTSLSLAGPNFVGYGEYLNENLVGLLENFASSQRPGAVNLQGQLWFDTSAQILKVFTGNQGYVAVSGVTNSGSQPSLGKNGDIWFNQSTEQMYVYDTSGTAGFKIIGPAYTKQQGVSGSVPITVEDGSISGTYHNILKLQYGNVTYATVSADAAFLPTPAIPGFSFVNPGITFSSNVINPTVNANVITSSGPGGLVMVDIVNQQLQGTVHGNVVATTLSGNLTGNVVGNLTGNVVATTLTGNLTGNVATTVAQATNFSSGNVVINGGYIQNLANVSANLITATTVNSVTAYTNNFSSGNILVTGGAVTGLLNFSTLVGQSTNFSSSNILVTGGSATGLTNFSTSYGQSTNFSSSNILVTGGSATGLTNFSATTGQATNFSSDNISVTGGSATGLTAYSGTTGQATNFSSSNILVSGGDVSGVTGVNNTFTSANLITSVATTKSANDNTTAVATTAFVHAVLPTGIIVMWNSTAASIPAGWQLCNGSNGTPDLRGQFVVGAGGSYTPGDTGGTNSVTLSASAMPIHTHEITGSLTTGSAGGHTHATSVTDPGHSHTVPLIQQVGTFGSQLHGAWNGGSTATTASATGITVTVEAALAHTHALTLSGNTQSAGGSGGSTQPHENRPPYYALCYIQKMY